MKKIALNLMGIAIVILVVYIIFLQECRRPLGYQIPRGKVLVSQGFLDSLEAIADLPPTIDTIIPDPIIIYVKDDKPLPQPEPEPRDTTINNYADSLITDYFTAWYNFQIQNNYLINRNWKYLITGPIKIIIEKPVPMPILYEVKVFKTGLYTSLRVGGEMHTGKFLFGADLDLVTKKRSIYGFQFTRFGDENLIGLKFGTQLFGK